MMLACCAKFCLWTSRQPYTGVSDNDKQSSFNFDAYRSVDPFETSPSEKVQGKDAHLGDFEETCFKRGGSLAAGWHLTHTYLVFLSSEKNSSVHTQHIAHQFALDGITATQLWMLLWRGAPKEPTRWRCFTVFMEENTFSRLEYCVNWWKSVRSDRGISTTAASWRKRNNIRSPQNMQQRKHAELLDSKRHTISDQEFETFWPLAIFYHNRYTLGLQILYSYEYVSHEHEYIFYFFIVQLWKLTEASRSSKAIVSGDWNDCHIKVTSHVRHGQICRPEYVPPHSLLNVKCWNEHKM